MASIVTAGCKMAVLILLMFVGALAENIKYYMDSNCGNSMGDFLALKQEREIIFNEYTANMDCQLTINTPIFSRLTFRFSRVDFPSCSDRVDIYDKDTSGDVIASGVCTDSESNVFIAKTENTVIRFRSGSSGHTTGGFTIIASIFYYPLHGYCTLKGFEKCDNGRCVWHDLKCNGRDSCGDRSDEGNCLLWLWILLGVLGALIIGAIIIAVCVVYWNKKNRKRVQVGGGKILTAPGQGQLVFMTSQTETQPWGQTANTTPL